MGCGAGSASGAPPQDFTDLPAPFNSRVDAILSKGGGSNERNYIFSGDQVIEYTTWPYAPRRVVAPPVAIANHTIFGKLPAPFNAKIDAVLTKPGGNGTSGECHYIFSGDQVMEITTWSYASTPVKAPPIAIASHSIFCSLPAPFNSKIDAVLSKPAAVSASAECHYMISGDQVMEFTTWSHAPERVKAPPMSIASHKIFGSLPAPFHTKIDAVLSKPSATVSGSAECHYVFSGEQVAPVTTWSYASSPLRGSPTTLRASS